MSNWIRTDERLPDVHQEYGYKSSGWLLGYWDHTMPPTPSMGVCMYETGVDEETGEWSHWIGELMEECTPPAFWMPLPDPPEARFAGQQIWPPVTDSANDPPEAENGP